jgi:hypothetical protein
MYYSLERVKMDSVSLLSPITHLYLESHRHVTFYRLAHALSAVLVLVGVGHSCCRECVG